jgi:hypothetical protein
MLPCGCGLPSVAVLSDPGRGVVWADFKNYIDLPLARIKRIMKSDEDVHMISAEVLVLFAKACDMFILEMTIRCAPTSLYSPHSVGGTRL